MNEIQIFNNPEFGEIRTLTIDGEPWFVGKDVAQVLGYKDTVNALKSHVDSEDKAGWQITTQFGTKETTIINESGLYSLILSSKLPGVKMFKRWVTSEVLPSIRKTGSFFGGSKELRAIFLLDERTVQHEERITALGDHVDTEDKGLTKCDTPGGTQEMINESGLYSLILSSKLPGAKKLYSIQVLPKPHQTGHKAFQEEGENHE